MTMTLLRSLTAVLIFTSATVAVGCATQSPPRPVTLDPANPAAPESPQQGTSQVLAPPLPEKPDAGATVFTCPMDPEVVSPKPGNCPKCGMKLVPKGSPGSGQAK